MKATLPEAGLEGTGVIVLKFVPVADSVQLYGLEVTGCLEPSTF